MKVAITGATGFLGKYLVSYLLENLYDVLVVARREEQAKECLPARVNVYITDYSFESLCEGLKDVEAVIHLAAQTMQRDSDPFRVSQFFAVNITMTENLLLAAKQAGVKKVCQMSSNSVYSSVNKMPFSERDNPIPATIYGVSKVYAEKLGEYFSYKSEVKVVSLRLARLFGYGERSSVVFTKYMNLANEGKVLEVWGEGRTSIEYLYVKDVVVAIEYAARMNIPDGIYNVGVNRSYSVLEIAESINAITGNTNNLLIDKSKPEGGYHILMDSEKFYQVTNWRPQWTLEEAITDMYGYYKKDHGE